MTLIQNPEFSNPHCTTLRTTLSVAFSDISNDLKAYAFYLCKNETEAHDLFQETGLKVFTNANKFAELSNFKAWAVTIMRNLFIKNYHQKNRRREIIERAPKKYFFNSVSSVADNAAESDIAYKELLGLIAALPDIYQRPFKMVCRGFKYAEIADELNLPLKTIKNRIRLARRKLKLSHALLVRN